MTREMDPNKIEELKVAKFKYKAILDKEIRKLNSKIKNTELLLDEQQKIQKKYLEMLKSDCTGKGEYRDTLMLPIEIKENMNNKKNLTEEQRKNLAVNYELALEAAHNKEEEFNQLSKTSIEREKLIKKYKKDISIDRKRQNKKEEEVNEIMDEIHKLDNRLNSITMATTGDTKKLINKPINKKGQK